MSFAQNVARHGAALLAFGTAVVIGLLVAVTIGGMLAGFVGKGAGESGRSTKPKSPLVPRATVGLSNRPG